MGTEERTSEAVRQTVVEMVDEVTGERARQGVEAYRRPGAVSDIRVAVRDEVLRQLGRRGREEEEADLMRRVLAVTRNAEGLRETADRLRMARAKRGESQASVTEATFMGQSTLSLYEKAQRDPQGQTLADLARFYGVSVDWMLGLSDDMEVRSPRREFWEG